MLAMSSEAQTRDTVQVSGQGQQADPDTLSNPSSSPPSSEFHIRRSSSIRFSQDTRDNFRSAMSSRHRRTSSTDEIIPIRTSEGQTPRNYNTNESPEFPVNGVASSESPATRIATADGQADQDKGKEKGRWYKKIAEKYGSISLENKGSVARDHLALERTFLAWMRTSLAFASIGIAITQLFRLNTSLSSRSSQDYEAAIAQVHQLMSNEKTLPFSPLVGHSLPLEYIEAIQAKDQASMSQPHSTLLDQLLNPPAIVRRDFSDLGTSAFDEDAAARLRHVGKPLGATFLGVSILVLFVGFHRYFESQHWIIKGKFPASRGSVALVGFIAGCLIISSLVVVLVIAPSTFEKKK